MKISLLTLTNRARSAARLSVFGYNEWTLGPPDADPQMHVTTELDGESGALLARNVFNRDFAGRVAFAACQRASGLGHRRSGGIPGPQRLAGAAGGAAARRRCRSASAPDSIRARPCTSSVTLAPGEARQMVFLLGQGADVDAVRELVRQFGASTRRETAWMT